MLRVNGNDLDIDPYPAEDGGNILTYNGEWFTGIAYEYFSGTDVLEHESQYINGREAGLQREYWQNGRKRIEYYSILGGGIYKHVKKWDEDGNLTYYVTYDDFGNRLRIIKHPDPNLEE
ncbi:hypothetical protein P8625_13615 [Tenacibaculum tangerinum]|uniref:Toxin-antitoxin system YwqK family antitoxin n=1 Tax=Tenacibaculum tangerinum TaxID=3038772 RepID=A0ABY8L0V5_9FLAO|nr:hypothetical protein [Tenacibaculum tangerinum]WGH75098.1 hypothetical protein P8625_13615 [Tenacibaculum tangerinum]